MKGVFVLGALRDKCKCFFGNKHMIVLVAIIVVVAIIIVMTLTKGDKEVEYRVLSDAEVPQQISSQVVPEYRGLERALACTVDDKIYVLVTRGEKPTSGYEIAIDNMEIEKDGGSTNLVVHAKFKDPEPGKSLSQVLTYPLQVAETNLTELPGSIELRVRY